MNDNENKASSLPFAHYKSLFDLETHYWWHQSRLNWAEYIIKKHIKNYNRLDVIDYGCGAGGFIYQLNSRLNFKNFLGVDTSPDAVNFAKNHGGNYALINSNDFEVIKNKNLILLMDVIEHIENDKLFLKNMLEVLNKGAYILIAVPANKKLYSNLYKNGAGK